VHKFDNALGGTKFDSGATGVLVNTGNKWVTGQFWTAERCDDPDHDNTPTPIIDRQHSGTRVYDVNTDGVDHYGLYPDWIEDLRLVGGRQIVDDMANGAEAYLQLWARAEAAAAH
jgi:hypothetical protein